MERFKEYLEEKFINIGFDKKDSSEKREKHRNDIHALLKNSYSSIGGYKGLGSGSDAESGAIHNDISKSMIKAVRKSGKLVAAKLYKDKYGRKGIASGHDGTDVGKTAVKKMMSDDIAHQRSWSELSGAPEAISRKMGSPEIPVEKMRTLLGKKLKPTTGSSYTRKIAGTDMKKTGFGFPKNT